jgi:hypothetical protein
MKQLLDVIESLNKRRLDIELTSDAEPDVHR